MLFYNVFPGTFPTKFDKHVLPLSVRYMSCILLSKRLNKSTWILQKMKLPFVQAKTFVCNLRVNIISLSVVTYTYLYFFLKNLKVSFELKKILCSPFFTEWARYIGEYMSQICFNFPTCSIYTHNNRNITIENALKFLLSQTKALHMT